jgi:hypothetical protein
VTRLFDRQLAQPDPVSLHDFLAVARDLGPAGDPTARRAAAMLADPRTARTARSVRPAGAGLLVDEVEGIPVVAAEAVHERTTGSDALELFARLRQAVVRPRQEALYVEVQKLRGQLGPVEAFGWLVICRPSGGGSELRAFLTAEVGGRGKALSPLATYLFDLDAEGRYVPEAETDAPAVRIAFPDDPAHPGLLPAVLEPVAMRLAPAVSTLLATLAVLAAADRPLEPTVPDPRQSNAYRKRSGRALVPYQRIPRRSPALDDLLPAPGLP